MTNLKLVADEPTALEKMLLDAARAELPSEAHRARLRAALGIGLPLSSPPPSLPPAVAGASGSTATTATASSGGASASAGARSLTFGKVVLGIAVAALVSAFMFTRHGAAPVPARAIRPSIRSAAAPVAVREAEPLPVVSPPPAVVEATAPPRVAHLATSSAPTADLSEQIRLIEAARASVAAHDAKAALVALDAYSAKFPRGSFGQEAMVLRIRALDQSGEFARATALAKAFVARFPSSPHVARLKPIAERDASR